MVGAQGKDRKGEGNAAGKNPQGKGKGGLNLSRSLILAVIVALSLLIGAFFTYRIGVRAVSEIENQGDRLSAVLPYGYGAKDIIRPLFDFTVKVVRDEMEPQMIFGVFIELFSALEDGVLTEGEFLVIINKIYAEDKICL
ncbi:MAG: hypothetical protein JW984_02590 [Deltaproteobacteria bacterium]|uniref:Uncharacterized protein n=1 Tax=Candidatus Zymogenus saltonus TaxID=2844893 RepID=A0A9D8KBX7_9DELT|nr:hypothetical protein [Candidatus Zymogenus saltonus]